MKLSNGIISVEIARFGAELKSAIKDGYEYMWCADEKYWARTSPVLFPFVGSLKDKCFKYDGEIYSMTQHGFARDMDFELVESSQTSAEFVLKSNEETLKKYPFNFKLYIKYIIVENTIKIVWKVENNHNKVISFSIGAHPAFNLKDGDNYFKFDTKEDIVYNLINESGLYDKNSVHILKNTGFVKITNDMFDNDALIIENNQAHQVAICDSNKKPYVNVKFDAQLFGLWSPAKKNAPFVCIEPWYGRCDSYDFDGEIHQREYVINLSPDEKFETSYEIELC